jgi:hypothetical protein
MDYINDMNKVEMSKVTGLGGYQDWRLPNRKELFSLIDHSRYSPALPPDHLFRYVQSGYYWWSSTAYSPQTDYAWVVYIWSGWVYYRSKLHDFDGYMWPVRSGQGSLGYSDISVTPTLVPFGNVNVGGTSDQIVTVKNDGTANLVIGTITNPEASFSKQTDNCSGQSIPPSGTCTVTYRFAPTSGGTFSSNSNIPSNDLDDNMKTIILTGTGVTVCPIPGTPASPLPSDGATGAATTPTLSWVATSNTDSYDVYFGTSPNPPFVGNTTSTSYPLSNLSTSTTYYWKIIAKNICGNHISGPIWGFTTSSFSITPKEGAFDTEITLTGYGFGTKKGKVLMGNTSLTIINWADGLIHCRLTRVLDPDVYDVTIQPSGPKGTPPIVEKAGFVVKAPEIHSIEQGEGTAYDEVTIRGKFFGTKKGKVYLEYEEGGGILRKSCKVTKWWMDPATNESEIIFVVPKMLPEVCDVVVDPYGDIAETEEDHGFEVKAPEIESVNPNSGSVGEEITISGNFFGSKKPKVYLGYMSNGEARKKSCSVWTWSDKKIIFTVPKLPLGTYDVKVTNSVDSDALPGGFVIK